jgi:hypothetical protein
MAFWTGMSVQMSRGRGFLKAVHPEDRHCVEDVIEASMKSRSDRYRMSRARARARAVDGDGYVPEELLDAIIPKKSFAGMEA